MIGKISDMAILHAKASKKRSLILPPSTLPIKAGKSDEDSESDAVVEERPPDIGPPGRFCVLLHNDDYTTMEFVIEVLTKFFRKTVDEADQLMMKVHSEGRAVAGIYTFEIAETKVVQVMEYAKAAGYPLKCTMEAE